MIDLQYLKTNSENFKKILVNRNMDPELVDKVVSTEKSYSSLRSELENKNREKNENADKLRNLQDKKSQEAKDLIENGKKIKEEIQAIEEKFSPIEKELNSLMYKLPNVYVEDTPIGKDEDENVIVRQVGEIPTFSFTPKAHWDIGPELDIIDIERGTKTSGSRFYFLKSASVILEFALIQHVLATVTNREVLKQIINENNLRVSDTPFVPVIPPVMIKPELFEKMGRLDPKEDKYHTDADDLYLIGSAEHTLGAMHSDEVFQEAQMPVRYIGFSTAFRREAGSYGKDIRGILRVHQFDKLEMETFSLPENGLHEQMLLVGIQEYLVKSLGIPYQLVRNSSGDMGKPDARQFDIECYMPGQGKYRETHSADYMTDFQSRRLNIRVKRSTGKLEYAHMNDATAFAIGRTLIAIIENYQQEDGSIKVPEVLMKYTAGMLPEGIIKA